MLEWVERVENYRENFIKLIESYVETRRNENISLKRSLPYTLNTDMRMHWYPATEFPLVICSLFRPWWSVQSSPFALVYLPCRRTTGIAKILIKKISCLRFQWFHYTTHFNITKHLFQVVTATTQCQMVENVLVHQFNVRVSQFDCSIVVSNENKIMSKNMNNIFHQFARTTFCHKSDVNILCWTSNSCFTDIEE